MYSPTDSGPVVPTDPLITFLERLQLTALNTFGSKNYDPKHYVDLSLKHNLSETQLAFDDLPKSSTGSVSGVDLNGFITSYFNGAGEDLVYAELPDFVPEPEGFLPAVENPVVREWALEVHKLWKNLSRRVDAGVFEHPELHTLLPLSKSVVVPGSRFREVYYWDSYWVISQPPLLSAMVYAIYSRTGDMDFARKSLPALLKEHHFWNSGFHSVTILDAEGCNRTLSRYYAMWNKPRPESSTIDMGTASKLSSASEKQHLYRELASGAETGWDFSSRWMRFSVALQECFRSHDIGYNLNHPCGFKCIILQMELNIAFLAKVTGDRITAARFLEAAEARKLAMNSVFWNEEMGQWLDYWISDKTTCKDDYTWVASNQNRNIFASNFIPLSVELFNSDLELVEKVRQSLQRSGLIRAVGIATSLTNSGQQWDFPNGWAPIQHLIVEGLVRSGSKEAKSLAKDIAARWIRTNYVFYKKTNTMSEKYDVEKCGEYGGGGEYVPQSGFGWSNGVVLAFLEEFGWPKDLKIDC
ncbi:hypothetical protein C3L33_01858, partial [Rhododendron williamsianum]